MSGRIPAARRLSLAYPSPFPMSDMPRLHDQSVSCRPSFLFRLPRLAPISAGLALAATPYLSYADISVIQPPTVVAASLPLRVTLLFAEDSGSGRGAGAHAYTVPKTLAVSLTSGDVPPQTLTLQRAAGVPDTLHLHAGQFRRVVYSAPWPASTRGTLRVQVADFNASPALVTLDRGEQQARTIAANRTAQAVGPADAGLASGTAASTLASAASTSPTTNAPEQAATAADAQAMGANAKAVPGATAAIPASGATIASNRVSVAETGPESRLSFYEPMYFGVGHNGHTTARFQLSFKYRIVTPKDPRSKSLLDNLYFGYTQVSLWDLTANSKPFRDTSYKPSLFYYLPDTGLRSRWFDSLGVQAGIEHESNGQAGSTSRSINIAYVQPIVHFNAPMATQLTIAPKVYYYLQKDENPDIAAYRGYMDLQIRYGRPDGLELFTTLRKGTHALNGSVDAQLTYPIQKLLGSGALGGYVWVGYFNGYGQTLLDYDTRQHWNVRIGYSIYR